METQMHELMISKRFYSQIVNCFILLNTRSILYLNLIMNFLASFILLSLRRDAFAVKELAKEQAIHIEP